MKIQKGAGLEVSQIIYRITRSSPELIFNITIIGKTTFALKSWKWLSSPSSILPVPLSSLCILYGIGYKTRYDAAQVSIVEDVPLLPTRNRSRPRSSTILHRWRRRRRRSSHQHHHWVRMTDAPLLRCEPANMKELYEVANAPQFSLLINTTKVLGTYLHI